MSLKLEGLCWGIRYAKVEASENSATWNDGKKGGDGSRWFAATPPTVSLFSTFLSCRSLQSAVCFRTWVARKRRSALEFGSPCLCFPLFSRNFTREEILSAHSGLPFLPALPLPLTDLSRRQGSGQVRSSGQGQNWRVSHISDWD